MTQTAPATPCLAKVPLDADCQAYALLIVHADRAIAPQPALRQVVEFESTPHGGFISAAQAHDGGWGYINEQGQWLVPPTLDNARGFTEDGVARLCRGGRWGYLNLLGQEVIAPQSLNWHAARTSGWLWCTSTWTTSRRSTTPSATQRATGCCARWPAACSR